MGRGTRKGLGVGLGVGVGSGDHEQKYRNRLGDLFVTKVKELDRLVKSLQNRPIVPTTAKGLATGRRTARQGTGQGSGQGSETPGESAVDLVNAGAGGDQEQGLDQGLSAPAYVSIVPDLPFR